MNQVFIPRSVEWEAMPKTLGTHPLAVTIVHVTATAMGGASVATAIAAVAHLASGGSTEAKRAFALVLTVVGLYAVRMQLLGETLRLLERRRQVPRRWLLWRHRTLIAAAYGLMVGAGVLTKVRHAAFYVTLCFFAVAPSVAAAAILGALYGVSRGGMLLLNWAYQQQLGGKTLGTGITIELPRVRLLLAIAATTFPIWIATAYYF
ncbi:MAG: hypothetical protein H0W90_15285 [Actinobacteria bacterium]|nr:hypothetical protein [Actinomycetota bacterium]